VGIVVLDWNNRDVTLARLENLAAAHLRGATVWLVDRIA
jgi:hypothetical protein